jgi:tetratricopeptide (TPR) repeat protein
VNLYRVGRKAEALALLQKSREFYVGDGGQSQYHFQVGWYYFQEKDYAQAQREMEEAVRLCRRCPGQLARLGHILAVSGKRAQAKEILRELQERSRREFVSPYQMAMIHAGLGALDQAFELIEKSYQAHDFQLFSLPEESFLLPLRSDRRFQDLLRRMNFPRAPRGGM